MFPLEPVWVAVSFESLESGRVGSLRKIGRVCVGDLGSRGEERNLAEIPIPSLEPALYLPEDGSSTPSSWERFSWPDPSGPPRIIYFSKHSSPFILPGDKEMPRCGPSLLAKAKADDEW